MHVYLGTAQIFMTIRKKKNKTETIFPNVILQPRTYENILLCASYPSILLTYSFLPQLILN